MRKTSRSKRIQGWLFMWLAFSLGVPLFGQSYLITDINEPSDSYRLAYAINAAGNIVGEYESTNELSVRAYSYNHGTNADLGVLVGYMDAYAHGINDSNEVAGWCDQYAGPERAFKYSKGTMDNLGTLGAFPTGGWSEAYAINQIGQVVGTATLTDTSVNHAVLWSGGTKKDLGALGGPTYNSIAYGINNAGVIVGESEVIGSIYSHAFIYSNDIMTDLQTLPGGAYSSANALNDSGVVVGESQTVTGSGSGIHAFVCPSGPGSMQDLGTLGGNESSAYGINSAGHIVGYAVNSNNISRAFLYDGSKMLDLNTLIPPGSGWENLEAAVGINDAGQIAGYGTKSGVYHAFLLTPGGPLSVTITNPAPNATFTAPATVDIGASVSDTAGTVTNVEFLVNGALVGVSPNAPYGATASNLPAGSYTLTAVASDDGGLKATNSIAITIISALAPITISNPSFSGGTFSFSFGTQTGHTYAAQFATPLSATNNWVTFTNLAGDGSTVRVTDSSATGTERYYRVVAQ